MSEPEPSPHSPPAPPEQTKEARTPLIPYAPAQLRRRVRIPVVGRWAIGFFGFIAWSAIWFFTVSSCSGVGVAKSTGFDGWVMMTIAILGIALFLRIQYGYKGYGYGVLSALLAAGLLVLGCILLILWTCATKRVI